MTVCASAAAGMLIVAAHSIAQPVNTDRTACLILVHLLSEPRIILMLVQNPSCTKQDFVN
jgi:hypothetical protein